MATNNKYTNVIFENQIDILFKQASFSGTRFEVYDFTFKNLMTKLNAEDIVNLFLGKNQVYNLQWDENDIGSENELIDIIKIMGLTRAWLNANKFICGTIP